MNILNQLALQGCLVGVTTEAYNNHIRYVIDVSSPVGNYTVLKPLLQSIALTIGYVFNPKPNHDKMIREFAFTDSINHLVRFTNWELDIDNTSSIKLGSIKVAEDLLGCPKPKEGESVVEQWKRLRDEK